METFLIKKAVILAGGKATRLYPVTKEFPKPLLPVQRKPIINYLVDNFYKHGVEEIAVLVSQDFREDFEWWKKRYYPEKAIKLIEEKEPLGTFGGAWFLKDWIGESHFFFTNGDELKEINLNKMRDFHLEKNCSATIALVKVPNPQDYGVVICEEGLVKEFLEKPKNPPTDYISSGFYLFTPDVFNYLPRLQADKAGHPGPKFCMVEKDLFPKLAKEKKLAGFQFEGKWMDCGTWERYQDALENW